MLKLRAESFYRVTSGLITLRSRVRELMRLEAEEHPNGGVTLRPTVDPASIDYMQDEATELLENLRTLGTQTTFISAQRLLDAVSGSDGFFWSQVILLSEEIDGRLKDELSLVKAFVLEPAKAQFYDPSSPLFGASVAEKFPSLSYEIDEAGKCLAFDRSTASVFHSVRCLEAGIGALSRCLGIPDPTKGADRTWGRLLGAMKTAMDSRWPPNNLDREGPDARLFERAYAALAAMMNPYRNETMHLAAKYTEEEARHIFDVVKGFMIAVASRCDENGEPKLS
jgi:hypothetical protein